MAQKSEIKDIRRLQQELKKAQHDLKAAELQDKREDQIRRLDWEKEKFKLQLEHDKERWTFDSKMREQAFLNPERQDTLRTLQTHTLTINDLKEKIGALTAQVAIYKPFFDKHMAEHKTEMV